MSQSQKSPATAATSTATGSSSAVSSALPNRLTVVPPGTVANGPAFTPIGQAKVNATISRQLVQAIHKAFAVELQMPLTAITKYDPARWALVTAKVTPAVLTRVYNHLAHVLPHASCASPANVGPELYYVAGYCDGDGCISTALYHPAGRKHPGYRARLHFGSNDPGALQDVQEILGANGKIYPVRRSMSLNRQMWVLVFDGVHALHALCGFAPYLRIKGPQALALLAFWFLGRQWVNPGPNGTPPAIRRVRRFWHQRLASMK